MCKMFHKLLIVILIVLGNSRESFPQALKEYDILTLAQSWPQTACWFLNKKWSSSDAGCSPCKMPESKTSWTLHGVWPSSLRGKHPVDCDNTYKFNQKLLHSALKSQMEQKWKSFNLKLSNSIFWDHEWKKHGTCALNLERTNSLPKYFTKSIEMLDEHNAGKILMRYSITPGKSYKIDDILRALKSSLGVNVFVQCSTNTVTRKQYLGEIQICFDKSFKLTNCNGENRSSCSTTEQIVYPNMLNSC